MASQAERRARTRKALLDAAETLINQHGFEATSVEHITEAARLAKGTFYQHFETKLDVLLELTRRQQDAFAKSVLQALESGKPPLEVGLEYIRGMASWCRSRGAVAGELGLRALERPHVGQESSTRVALTRILEAAQRRGEIRADKQAAEIAIVITGAMLPPMVYWARHPEAGDITDWLTRIWQFMLEGAMPR